MNVYTEHMKKHKMVPFYLRGLFSRDMAVSEIEQIYNQDGLVRKERDGHIIQTIN